MAKLYSDMTAAELAAHLETEAAKLSLAASYVKDKRGFRSRGDRIETALAVASNLAGEALAAANKD